MILGAGRESDSEGPDALGNDNGDDPDAPRCSAKGCRRAATVDLSWRNPSLHDATRLKHWLACDDHADHLADFLARRSFLLGREPFVADHGVITDAERP